MPYRVSIAIPTFNRAAMLPACLDSALAQQVDGVEIVVVDNHSMDATEDVVRGYASSGVRFFKNDRNIGLFPNFNECLRRTTGEIRLVLCSDDRLKPGMLKQALDVFERDPRITVLSTLAEYSDAQGTRIGVQKRALPPGYYAPDTTDRLLLGFLTTTGRNPLNYPSGVLFKSSDDRFREDLPMGADLEFFLRQARRGGLYLSDHIGCEVTFHSGSESTHLADSGFPISDKARLISEVPENLLAPQLRDRLLRSLKAQASLIAAKRLLSLNRVAFLNYVRETRSIPGSYWGVLADACRLITTRVFGALRS